MTGVSCLTQMCMYLFHVFRVWCKLRFMLTLCETEDGDDNKHLSHTSLNRRSCTSALFLPERSVTSIS